MRWVTAIYVSACSDRKQDELIKMAYKNSYVYDKNMYYKRPPFSITGVPRLLVPQKVSLGYHRNPKIMGCILSARN